MLLSERRTGPEKALREFYEVFVGECPEMNLVLVCGLEDLPSGAEVVFSEYDARTREFADWVENLPRETIVICAQELCHQVSAIFRYQ